MRNDFSSTSLVRLLGQASGLELAPASADLAGRLAPWLHAFDAMTLHGAHQAIELDCAVVAPPPQAMVQQLQALEADTQQLQRTLVQAIERHGAPTSASQSSAAHLVALPAAYQSGLDYGPYRRAYSEQQRLMDLKIAPLRDRVRQAMLSATARLQQLAELDRALEQMLAARAARLWQIGPQLMARRFEQLRQSAGAPEQWLDEFARSQRQTQLAELEVRLQPVLGLIETFRQEVKKSL